MNCFPQNRGKGFADFPSASAFDSRTVYVCVHAGILAEKAGYTFGEKLGISLKLSLYC